MSKTNKRVGKDVKSNILKEVGDTVYAKVVVEEVHKTAHGLFYQVTATNPKTGLRTGFISVPYYDVISTDMLKFKESEDDDECYFEEVFKDV